MKAEEIVKKLEECSEAYYAGEEIVDDATFDALEDELKAIDPDNPYFSKLREKPGKYGTKVKHIYEFIGSIDKIHSVSESKILNGQYEVGISAKLDGTSLVTYFRNGTIQAVTRGDGYYGMDVTQHYLAITKKYNVTVPSNFTGAIRGEVVFKKENWLKFKERHPEAKAPRNSGTGLINQKFVQEDEELLDYVVYKIIATNNSDWYSMWDALSQFGYPVAPHKLFLAKGNPSSAGSITDETLKQLYDEWSTIYPCDGLVIRQSVLPHFVDNGRYQYKDIQEAYKFQAEVKVCTVKDITWQLGRTGKLTPVLNIDPVEMSGAIVSNITAHNAAMVKENGLGKDAVILAYRSGEVIPTFKETIRPAAIVEIPMYCPYCGHQLEYSPTRKDLYCTYEDCQGQIKYKIFNFIEQLCSDVKGIGEAFEEAFLADLTTFRGYPITTLGDFVSCVEDCWHLDGTVRNFPSLGNADNKVAAKIVDIICSPKWDAEKFYLALGIKLLGTEAAKKLASNSSCSENLLDAFRNGVGHDIKMAALAALPGQVALATNICEAQMTMVRLLNAAPYLQLIYKEQKETRYYAITGSLSKPRKEFQAELAEQGWQMTDNISKAELLITDDPAGNSSKNVKARQLNKVVISEQEFRSKYLR